MVMIMIEQGEKYKSVLCKRFLHVMDILFWNIQSCKYGTVRSSVTLLGS